MKSVYMKGLYSSKDLATYDWSQHHRDRWLATWISQERLPVNLIWTLCECEFDLDPLCCEIHRNTFLQTCSRPIWLEIHRNAFLQTCSQPIWLEIHRNAFLQTCSWPIWLEICRSTFLKTCSQPIALENSKKSITNALTHSFHYSFQAHCWPRKCYCFDPSIRR
jgi:hypothetical protein